MFIFSILVIGILNSLVSYIPKEWIKRHIYEVLDKDDPNF